MLMYHLLCPRVVNLATDLVLHGARFDRASRAIVSVTMLLLYAVEIMNIMETARKTRTKEEKTRRELNSLTRRFH